MTAPDTGAAPIAAAVETIVAELEREHDLPARIRRDAEAEYRAESEQCLEGEPNWTKQTDENGLYDPGW